VASKGIKSLCTGRPERCRPREHSEGSVWRQLVDLLKRQGCCSLTDNSPRSRCGGCS